MRTMLKSKIHRATVTRADLYYVGPITIDADLMDAADLLEGEQVTIVDVDNGNRLVTYAITGERGSGVIGINGAAAHLVHPGDGANRQVDVGHSPAFVPAGFADLSSPR